MNIDETDSDIIEHQLSKVIGTGIWKIEQCDNSIIVILIPKNR